MISPTTTILRINKLGKPYVQSTDPSLTHRISANDIWLNPVAGTMKTWNGSAWEEMQFGASAIMDDCIANRMLANDISANKITATGSIEAAICGVNSTGGWEVPANSTSILWIW